MRIKKLFKKRVPESRVEGGVFLSESGYNTYRLTYRYGEEENVTTICFDEQRGVTDGSILQVLLIRWRHHVACAKQTLENSKGAAEFRQNEVSLKHRQEVLDSLEAAFLNMTHT